MKRLRDFANQFAKALGNAGIPYRVIGGYAVFVYVDGIEPLKARLTADLDVAVDRADLLRIGKAAETFGFEFPYTAGIDMLVDAADPPARSAVHMVFVREKLRPEYVESVPGFSEPTRTAQGVLLAPVADLVRMKLNSFRLKDKLHIQDMDSVGLITLKVEASLPEILRARLAEVRATQIVTPSPES
jgi:hypothetical protein